MDLEDLMGHMDLEDLMGRMDLEVHMGHMDLEGIMDHMDLEDQDLKIEIIDQAQMKDLNLLIGQDHLPE